MPDLTRFQHCRRARTASQATRRGAQVEILALAGSLVPLLGAVPKPPAAWRVTHSGHWTSASDLSGSVPRQGASEFARRETLALLGGRMNSSEPQLWFASDAALLRQGGSSGGTRPRATCRRKRWKCLSGSWQWKATCSYQNMLCNTASSNLESCATDESCN
jgi:hypothetical protein